MALALAALALPAESLAVVGPPEIAVKPVQTGQVSRASIPFSIASDEQVPAAQIEGGRAFTIEADRCVSPRTSTACRVRVRFAPTANGMHSASLVVGNATVRLVGTAFGVGPSLVATPGGFTWTFRTSGPRGMFDPVRRVRIINQGDAAVTITGLAIRGRDAESFAIDEEACDGKRLASEDECRIAIRLLAPAGAARLAHLEISTDLPQEPFEVTMGTNVLSDTRALCPCANPKPLSPGSSWVLGVIGASFARGVVTNIYTSVAAKVRVTVFRGKRALRATRTRQLIGQQSIVAPGALRRGSYRLRVAGRRGGKERRVWWTLRVP